LPGVQSWPCEGPTGGGLMAASLAPQCAFSPRVGAILEQCEALDAVERTQLLQALGARGGLASVAVALRAWSGEGGGRTGAAGAQGSVEAVATSGWTSAPAPSRPSRATTMCAAVRSLPQAAGQPAASPDCTAACAAEPSLTGTELLVASPDHAVGCPWCRRPVTITVADPTTPVQAPAGPTPVERCAYVTLLYGPRCHSYFLGALVLGWGLRRHAACNAARVLLHTPDIPEAYLEALASSGWTCQRVAYLSGVASAFFHNWRKSRFVDVFTKLRALQLTAFDKVLLLDLDLLVRAPASGGEGLESLFALPTPAAMKRGLPVPAHGEQVSYCDIWEYPARRSGDNLPQHQQASGINAGVMLLRPDTSVFDQMEAEVKDWYHPEHYATYMPEQEYLSRFYGTYEQWTHIACHFNFEIDKNERIPHDWTPAHQAVRDASAFHPGVVVLHYSGTGVKPWDLLYQRRGDATTLRAQSAQAVEELHRRLAAEGPGDFLEGYADTARLWAALLEWLEQFSMCASELAAVGHDPLALVRGAAERDAAAAAGGEGPGT